MHEIILNFIGSNSTNVALLWGLAVYWSVWGALVGVTVTLGTQALKRRRKSRME